MARIEFPSRPNASDVIGMPLFVSDCGKYRILKVGVKPRARFYVHRRGKKRPKLKSYQWNGIFGRAFTSLIAAIGGANEDANKSS